MKSTEILSLASCLEISADVGKPALTEGYGSGPSEAWADGPGVSPYACIVVWWRVAAVRAVISTFLRSLFSSLIVLIASACNNM